MTATLLRPIIVPPVTEAPASPTPAELGARVDEYLHHLEHLRNASPHTVTAYRRALTSFFRHLDGPLSGVAIRSWLADLERANLGPRSRALYLAAVRAYARWDEREHETGAWKLLLVRRTPRTSRFLPVWFKAGQIERLFAHLEQRTDGVGWRNRAIVEFAYSTGARLAEVVGLNVGDLDLDVGDALLRVKGRKEIRVPLGRPAREALGNWLSYRARLPEGDGAVFLAIGRRGQCGGRLSPRSLQLIFAKITTEVFGTPIRFHALRHSCASHMLDAGASLRAIQDLLGHASINSTCVYTHTALTRLNAIHRMAHPRDKMVPLSRRMDAADEASNGRELPYEHA